MYIYILYVHMCSERPVPDVLTLKDRDPKVRPYMYIYVYVYIRIYILYVYVYIFICLCTHICMRSERPVPDVLTLKDFDPKVRMCIYMSTDISIDRSICFYIYVCVCIYVCVYILYVYIYVYMYMCIYICCVCVV